MADPISFISGGIAIFDGLKEFYRFSRDMIVADKERKEFQQRLDCVADLEDLLNEVAIIERDQPGLAWVERLYAPATGLGETMVEMMAVLKLKETTYRQKMKNFKWHSEKKSLDHFFVSIEGYCNRISTILVSGNLVISRDTNTITRNIALNQKLEQEEKQARREQIQRQKIQAWLSPLDFQARQRGLFSAAAKVGGWFLNKEEFKVWEQGKIKVLRCYGESGAGKTVLSSIIVDHLMRQQPPGVPVLCVYLEKTPSDPHTPETLLGSLLKQLIQFKKTSINPDIRDAYTNAANINASPTEEELTELLEAEISDNYERVLIIVDGLDEASIDTRNFVERQLRQLCPDIIRLLTTSRPDEEPFQKWMTCNICAKEIICYFYCENCPPGSESFHVCEDCHASTASCTRDPAHTLVSMSRPVFEITIRTPDEDLKKYVKSMIEEQMPETLSSQDMSSAYRLATELGTQCKEDPDLFANIVSEVVEIADGRFQLAKQFTRSISDEMTARDIDDAMKSMKRYQGPHSLDLLYEKDMTERIKGQDKKKAGIAMRILSLVSGVHRKLKLRELQHALAVRDGDTSHDARGELPRHRILSITKGLIKIDEDADETIRLEHQTWYEYFSRTRSIWFERQQIDIAYICLNYLSYDILSKPCPQERVSEIRAEFIAKEESHPFISYAAQFWGDHVREAGPEVEAAATTYLKSTSRLEAYIQAAWAAGTQDWDVRRTIHPLHICAWFDLPHLVSVLDSQTSNIDIREGTYGQTPLMYACRRGNMKVARRLLELGASASKISKKGRTALAEAIFRTSEDEQNAELLSTSASIVEILLYTNPHGHEVDVNVRSPEYLNRTALMIAIRRMNSSIALLILKHPDVQVNLQDSEGFTALSIAACKGLTKVVDAILILPRPKVDLELTDRISGRSALILAGEEGHSEVIELLLSHGARAEATDSKGRTAIMRAVEEGKINAARKLVELRADLSSKDKFGRSLMHGAAEKGQAEMLELLEGHVDQVNAVDEIGMTPLHSACRFGHIEVAKRLLVMGADLTIQDACGRTAFDVAWQYGHTQLMDLCRADAVVSTQIIPAKDLPIWALVIMRELDLITKLISEGTADLSLREPGSGNTALHCALMPNEHDSADAGASQSRILEELLQGSIWYLDEPDQCERTPLHLAALSGNMDAVTILLEFDPKLDELDQFGLTPLSIAFKNQNLDIAVALIEVGADIVLSKVDRNEMMFAAIELANVTAFANIISAGADRLAHDKYGRTVDMVAEQCGGIEFRALLQSFRSLRYPVRRTGTKTGTGISVVELNDNETAVAQSFKPFQSRMVELHRGAANCA